MNVHPDIQTSSGMSPFQVYNVKGENLAKKKFFGTVRSGKSEYNMSSILNRIAHCPVPYLNCVARKGKVESRGK